MNSRKPKVTVAMAVHNGAGMVRIAIESILRQTEPDWEMIVVDDASSDATDETLRATRDPRIRLLRNSRNLGLAASLNRAIAGANGTFVARMDADDVCFPERFASQLRKLQSSTRLAVVGTPVLMFKGDGIPLGVLPVPTDHESIVRRCEHGMPVFHPTWMARASWLKRHPYDTDYRKAQDYELLLRARAHSCFGNVDEVLLGYRYESDSLRKRLETRRYVARALVENRSSLGSMKVLKGFAGQLIKAGGDLAVSAAGVSGTRDRLKCVQPDEALLARWSALWRQLAVEARDTCVE
jgi:glycosyltransferase involved in cell wall biosynthesis